MSGRRSTSSSFRTGSRVQYTFVSNGEKKRIPGQILYGPGPFHLKPNENDWCGVVLEEPYGKNNGTIQGRQYFECPDNFGVFVRASTLRSINDSSSRLSYPRSGSTTPSTTPSMTPSSSIASFTGMFESGHSPSGGGGGNSKSNTMSESLNVPVSKIKPPTRIMSTSSTSIQQDIAPKTGIPTSLSSLTSKDSRSIRQMVEKIETKRDEKLREQNDTQDISTHNDASPTSHREVLELQEKVKDLESKLNTLMVKRAEDRAKFKDFERLKIQNEQLSENKKQMSEKCSELSKLQASAEKEGREAREEQLRQSEEIKDLIDSAEMAVIDKEMAENKAEQLQIELEQTKEQLEEAKIDFELLKSEIEDKGVDGAANSFQLKQLEEQNVRFRDALLKFRDISAGDRNNIQMLQKELELKSEELSQLMGDKDKNRTELAKCYEQIEELKEQVDMALGSQQMVERLTDKNLEFEDKVEELQKALDEEENIKEISNMIIEAKDELIADLRDEIDKYKTNIVKFRNSYVATQEAMKDHESTIFKFRELVSVLKEENRMLRSDKEQDLSKVQKAVDVQKQLENIEFKARLLDRRDLSKSIDMELRQLDVDQCYRYMVYLARFFPESFFVRGGDHDAIAVLMFVPRIFAKCSILERQIVEKQQIAVLNSANNNGDGTNATTPDSILREMFDSNTTTLQIESLDKLKQQIFTKHILYLLCSIRSILGKYQDVLSRCDSDLFMKIGSLFPELSVHEKSIDHYVDLLRNDKLDDTVTLDSLEKTLNYLQSLYSIYMANSSVSSTTTSLISPENTNNHNKMLNDLLEVLRTGTEATFIDVKILGHLVVGDVSMFISSLETTLNDIDQFVRKIRRRMVSAGSGTADTNPACILHFPPVIEAELFDSSNNLSMIVRCLKTIRSSAMAQFVDHHLLRSSNDNSVIHQMDGGQEDSTSTSTNIKASSDAVYHFSMDDLEKISKELTGNSLKSLSEMLTTVMGSISKFSTSLQQGDFDVSKSGTESGTDSLGPQSLSGPLSTSSNPSTLLTMQHFNSLSSIQSLFSTTNSANQNRSSLQTMLCLPLDDRALKWRAQTDQIGEYRTKIITQEGDISELKRALKIKIDEVSEMQIRRDIAEKKLSSAHCESSRLQEDLDRLVKEFNEKEAEREKTLNKYNQEINELYSDHRMMKEKLKDYTKREGGGVGGKMLVSGGNSVGIQGGGIGAQSTPNSSSLINQTSSLAASSSSILSMSNTSPVHSFQHSQHQHSTPSSTTSPFQSMIYSGIQHNTTTNAPQHDVNDLQRQCNDLRDALKRMAKRNYQLRMLSTSDPASTTTSNSGHHKSGPYSYWDNNLNAKPLWYIETLRSSASASSAGCSTLQETISEFNLIPDIKELKMQELRNKLLEFKYDFWRHRCETSSLVLPSIDNINKSKPGWTRCLGDLIRKSSQQESLKELQFVRRFDELKCEIAEFIKSYDDGYSCQATYTSFMATHVTKAMESKPQLVARITVPSSQSSSKIQTSNLNRSAIPIEVTFAELKKLHATLMF